MTFIPSEKSSRKRPWELPADEWRLLMITFVGGLASIVVGAGLIGAALALDRVSRSWAWGGVTWLLVILGSVAAWTLVAAMPRFSRWMDFGFPGFAFLLGLSLPSAVVFTLMMVGVAAGVH